MQVLTMQTAIDEVVCRIGGCSMRSVSLPQAPLFGRKLGMQLEDAKHPYNTLT